MEKLKFVNILFWLELFLGCQISKAAITNWKLLLFPKTRDISKKDVLTCVDDKNGTYLLRKFIVELWEVAALWGSETMQAHVWPVHSFITFVVVESIVGEI